MEASAAGTAEQLTVGVKAEWNLQELVMNEAEDDPFADVDIEDVGEPIHIGPDSASLATELNHLTTRINRLWAGGTTCELMLKPDVTCHACPLYTEDWHEKRSALCGLGRQQEATATQMAVLTARESDAQPQAHVVA